MTLWLFSEKLSVWSYQINGNVSHTFSKSGVLLFCHQRLFLWHSLRLHHLFVKIIFGWCKCLQHILFYHIIYSPKFMAFLFSNLKISSILYAPFQCYWFWFNKFFKDISGIFNSLEPFVRLILWYSELDISAELFAHGNAAHSRTMNIGRVVLLLTDACFSPSCCVAQKKCLYVLPLHRWVFCFVHSFFCSFTRRISLKKPPANSSDF